MKKITIIGTILLFLFLIGATISFPPWNASFEHIDSYDLFESADSIVYEVFTDSSATNAGPYLTIKFLKTGADTVLSNVVKTIGGNTLITGKVDSLGGDSVNVELYLGKFEGIAYGDTLGMVWYKLKSFGKGQAGKFKIALIDSSWWQTQASPFTMLKIVEKSKQSLRWGIDIIGLKE